MQGGPWDWVGTWLVHELASVPREGSPLWKPWTTQKRASFCDITCLGLNYLLNKMGMMAPFLGRGFMGGLMV